MTQYFLDRDLYVYPSPADTEFGFGGALSKVEFDEDTEGVTLIAPAALIDSPPSELVQADVSFATITPSRQLYCLDSMDPVVMPCSAPPLKELRSEARRDGKSNGSG